MATLQYLVVAQEYHKKYMSEGGRAVHYHAILALQAPFAHKKLCDYLSQSTWLPGPETLRQQLGWGSSRAASFRSQGGKNCGEGGEGEAGKKNAETRMNVVN